MNRLKFHLRLLWIDIKYFFKYPLLPLQSHSRVLSTVGIILLYLLVHYVLPFLIAFGLFLTTLFASHTYEFLLPAEQIVRIEIVHIPDDGNFYDADIDDTVPVTVLDKSQWNTFLTDFKNIRCYTPNPPSYQFENGAILITYDDGSYELISDSGAFYSLNAPGEDSSITCDHFDDEQFASLLTSYGYQEP